jgi:alpha-beta hydrolase superfamily lysophospholipase
VATQARGGGGDARRRRRDQGPRAPDIVDHYPETGQIFYEAGFANFHLHPPTEVHFKSEKRAPLLIVGAEKDHTVPASLSRKQYEKYEKSEPQTDYVEFPGRPHLMMVAEGWQEIADTIEGWIDGVISTPGARQEGISA